ncbi:hypothetical protein JOM56_010043 [Amanita muscaria]
MSSLQTQCALNANDQLKDANDIEFYYPETDMTLIALPGDYMRRSSRPNAQRMQEYLDAAKLDDDGNLTKKFQHPAAARSNFQTRESTESETDGGSGEISNTELAATLVSKIIPKGDRLTSCRRPLLLRPQTVKKEVKKARFLELLLIFI